ncbi:hypothetical protein K432DRAFT_424820 [Lepidopterella palustris CBS 459.81]|uniref:Transmembrane protein n=1 Tax=Lepidopterella palustris CBS 459.81 TaxID=1314670 RepID=A0A8E2ED13_9PEZI|nr:hypothetical protein K432DRAFT_424820 [Lepidopterella palustris CBS 459.81]
MKLSFLSLFALSSLMVSSFAAPTASFAERDVVATQVEKRSEVELTSILSGLVTEVFSFTASINVTVTSCGEVEITETVKSQAIVTIQAEIQKIITAISNATFSIIKLKLQFYQLVETDFELVISSCVQIMLECVYTFLNAIAVLKCSIFDLLGFYLVTFLNTYIAFLTALGTSVANFIFSIQAAFQAHLHVIGEVFIEFGTLLECL